MTRFARAKGSKASNERLPEQATSWTEMKQELLNKNKELEDKKHRENVMEQRQANYEAFLKDKEDEEDKNVSWADFPGTHLVEKHETLYKPTKRKLNSTGFFKDKSNSLGSNFEKKKVKKMKSSVEEADEVESEASDEEFSFLKSQIDKVLSRQSFGSDSDSPPEEAGTKEKPLEIVVKKAKKPKQKLQILLNQKSKPEIVKKDSVRVKAQDNKVQKDILTDNDKKKIEKKQERYKKQLEKKKFKIKEKKIKKDETLDDNIETNSGIIVSESGSPNSGEIVRKKIEKKLQRRKQQKEKKVKKKQEIKLDNTLEKNTESLTEEDITKIQKKKDKKIRQVEKRKKFKEAKALAIETGEINKKLESESTDGSINVKNISKTFDSSSKFQNKHGTNENNSGFKEQKSFQKHLNKQQERKAKTKDKKDFQRNKPKSEIMIINGRSVEIDYVDGFPVKKEDAERLTKLRKEMISKGLPRSEINVALKLERRRAEKALAREKKNVCFNCRKSGHNLSECPELGKDQVAQTSGTGICFKCGSTEHTHFECKVVKGHEYKFATCFICKEQGHISRQCPDNQRGLYPKGGSCKVCGDVTHLKKDCPKYQAQQAQLQVNLSVQTIDNRNPDDLGSNLKSNNNSEHVKRLNKKIKF